MPLNKIALIRYKTIDRCLRNRNRNWTLENLIEACSEAVNKAEGTNKGASKRTIQGDLQLMRDPEMGYSAPITVIAKKYYTYADADYSIIQQTISKQDEGMIQEAVDFMKQLQDFDHFKPYDRVVGDLESIIKKETLAQPVHQSLVDEKPPVIETIPPVDSAFSKSTFQQQGSQIVSEIYTKFQINKIKAILTKEFTHQNLNQNGTFFSLNKLPKLKQALYNSNLQNLLNTIDANARLTSAKYYNQIPTANWFTALHQNITITVKEKVPAEGFTGWSKKEGVTSVMAPAELLHNCFTLYIHLNHANSTNGALQILPGSHKKILNMHERNLLAENAYTQVAAVKAGGVHCVKPLLLQAFGKTTEEIHAVHLLQFDFCSVALTNGLEWMD